MELFTTFDKEQTRKTVAADIAKQEKKINRLINYIREKDIDIQYGQTVDNEHIFIANWNDKKFDKIGEWLENSSVFDYGFVHTGYDDDHDYCSECYKWYSTQPDYYGGEPKAIWVSDCDRLCKSCALGYPEDIEEFYNNQYDRALPAWAIDTIKKLGYFCLDDANNESCKIYENGLHPGQNDTPADIIKNLEKEGFWDKYDYIFCINSTGQFDCRFSLFVKERG